MAELAQSAHYTALRSDARPDRMLAAHPELFVGDPDALPIPTTTRALPVVSA